MSFNRWSSPNHENSDEIEPSLWESPNHPKNGNIISVVPVRPPNPVTFTSLYNFDDNFDNKDILPTPTKGQTSLEQNNCKNCMNIYFEINEMKKDIKEMKQLLKTLLNTANATNNTDNTTNTTNNTTNTNKCSCNVCSCMECRECMTDEHKTYSVAQMFGTCCNCNYIKTGNRICIVDE